MPSEPSNRPTAPNTAASPPGLGLVIALLGMLLVAIAALMLLRPIERPPAGVPAEGAPARWPDMRLDLNTASAAKLTLLPGIGPTLAERIVAHRRAHGRFETFDDLLDVPRIGPTTIERIKPHLVIENPDPPPPTTSANPGRTRAGGGAGTGRE